METDPSRAFFTPTLARISPLVFSQPHGFRVIQFPGGNDEIRKELTRPVVLGMDDGETQRLDDE